MIHNGIAILALSFYAILFSNKTIFYIIDFLPLFFILMIRYKMLRGIFKQLLGINIFIIALLVTLLLSGFGIEKSLTLFIRINAVTLFAISLYYKNGYDYFLRGVDFLHISDKLTVLLFFTFKQIEILKRSFFLYISSLKARGFEYKFNRFSFEVYGKMVGFLIITSLARSQNLILAMKSRGFEGRLYFFEKKYNGYLSITFIILFTLFILKNIGGYI